MRAINLIVIHCSASPNGVFISPERVDQWHSEPRPGLPKGFNRAPSAVAKFNSKLTHIGYHWLIGTDGRAYPGRHTEEIGAHVAGFNPNSVGICLVGTNKFFFNQFTALSELLCTLAQTWQYERLTKQDQVAYSVKPAMAIALFKKMGIRIVGHRDLSPDKNGDGKITSVDWLKTCPGFDVATWLACDMMPAGGLLLDGEKAISDASPNVRVTA